MLPKLKKLLKKSLIEGYTRGSNSQFSLESSTRLKSKIDGTNTIGSNVNQICASFNLKCLNLKLPLTINVFNEKKELSQKRTSAKLNLGASALIIVKRNNLLVKSENNKSIYTEQDKTCLNLQALSIMYLLGLNIMKKSQLLF